MASVRDIAKHAKVSKTTVSMVLRNQDGVSEKLRHRVFKAVEYLRTVEETKTAETVTASANEHSSSHGEEKLCSLLLLHPSNYHSSAVFHEIIHGIQAAASVYHLQLNLAFNDANLLSTFEEFYFSNPLLMPTGVLVIGSRVEEPLVDRLCELSVPVVLVGRRSYSDRISSVGRNEVEMACAVTHYLFDLGHRKIAFLGACDKFHYAVDRLRGFRYAHQQTGFLLDENLIHYDFDIEATANFLIDNPQITGAVFVNELLASQVLPLVQAAGRIIPDDLSAIGFDDTEIGKNFNPPLTTVSYPFFQEGFWAVRLIMEQVRQPMIVSTQMVLGASLIKRESCRMPKDLI
jgi:DNA-binding LacI/PurR family transcriptional regulator